MNINRKFLIGILVALLQIFTYSQQNYTCNFDDSSIQHKDNSRADCNKTQISFEEIANIPDVTFTLAFHFKANAAGQNFHCDANNQNNLYAPNVVTNVINEMNERMSKAVFINGIESDAKISFVKSTQGSCSGIFFYTSSQQYQDLPNAINVHFFDTQSPTDLTVRGGTWWGVNWIQVENVLKTFLNGSNNTWDLGRLINHEFSHTRNLNHAFYCSNPCNGIDLNANDECCGTCATQPYTGSGCWACSQDDLMMSYGTQLHYTKCEVEQMWNYMINNPTSYQSFDICSNPGTSEIVFDLNTTQIWAEKRQFNSDVRIKTGTTIEVQCEVLMGNNKRFIVKSGAKLIVNGGKISNLCNGLWQGIKAYGGNTDFDVKFTNNAIIENTSAAAVSMFAPEPWPQIQQWGNGILHADHTAFNNTRRIIEMMAWKPSFNSSYIRDCVQNGGKWSITNWNCIGVEVKDNVFNNITDACIVTETGQFLIQGNEFHSVNNDILFANVSPGFGTVIRQNDFYGNSTGVRAIGTTIAQNEIRKNQFFTGEFDIFMDGVNSYLIEDNDITSDFGAVSIENGIHSNEVFDNRLTGNFIGLAPIGNNQDYNFHQNCFTTSFADSYIEGQISGIVSAGTNGAANNCFTHQGNASSLVFDITGSPSPFNYVEPNDNVVSCLDAIKAHPNVTRIMYGQGQTCDGGTGEPIPPQYNPCNPFKTIVATTQAINWLNAKIIEVQNNPNLTFWQKKWFVAMYRRCLQRVTWIKYELLLAEGLYSDARALLATDSRDEAKTAIYASYIYENNLQGASSYLQSLGSTSEALGDFKTIQQINLNRLPYGPFYQASSSELSTVLTIAQKSHTYAGYGKALYYHLSGELLQSDLPDIFNTHLNPRSANKKEITASIYPNPFTQQFTVKYNGEKEGLITVCDLVGKTIFTSAISNDMIVSANGWREGMYIVTIHSDNEVLVQEKIILIH